MSLEDAIKELNDNIIVLNKAMLKIAAGAGDDADDSDDDVPAKKPAKRGRPAKKKAPAKRGRPAKKVVEDDEEDEEDEDDDMEEEEAEDAGALNYNKHVKPKVLEAISTNEGKEAVAELFEEYDVSNAKEIKPKDYKKFLKQIAAIIEEHGEE